MVMENSDGDGDGGGDHDCDGGVGGNYYERVGCYWLFIINGSWIL